MKNWENLELSSDQKHWSAWTARRPKRRLAVNNYMSALVFAMSAFAVLANYSA